MKINKILIVGGGSSGWMTAAALAYKFPEIDLTLVESKRVGTIGVGESTLGHINTYMNLLDMEDEEWMPACNATYKNSIQFTDFREKGTTFQYPFGGFTPPNGKGINDFFEVRSRYPDEFEPEDFARIYAINTLMAEHNKMTDETLPGYNYKLNTAYHMDAEAFGQYLRERFCSNITHITDDVVNVEQNEAGVSAIVTAENGTLTADLYIDCTGFKSLILEETLGIQFNNFKTLPNDRAVAARIPYTDEESRQALIHNVTDCKALSNGWMWTIPLWNRLGTGYVYSSKFISDEDAEKEFRAQWNWEGDVRFLRFRHGYHDKAWEKNVVAVGLSYGFIEPLESTGLMTTHENILKLVETLQRRRCNVGQFDKDIFNKAVYHQLRSLSDFVAMHYALSMRDDTPYWRTATDCIHYDTQQDDVVRESNLAREVAFMMMDNHGFDPSHEGMTYICAGMDYNPITSVYADKRDFINNAGPHSELIYQSIKKDMLEQLQRNKDKVATMMSHCDFLKERIYKQ